MKFPSKRAAAMAEADRKKDAAVINKDVAGFAAAIEELEAAEVMPDEFTCLCGEDFASGPHVEILAAAILVYGENGEEAESFDYGLGQAKRIKICGDCASKWALPITEYVNLR